jgi:SAM-dependent methyltransferase
MRNSQITERRFAEFYRLYAEDFDLDVPIYRDLAAKFNGPVLEVGCRTGRVTIRLAAAGHEVWGIDTHRPMLEIAQSRINEFSDRARVLDLDLRAQMLPQGFHACFVSLYTFNALIDVEEQRLFVRHLKRSMRSPGVVVLDLFCPLSFVRPDEVGEWRVIEREVGDSKICVRDRREMLTPLLERRTQVFSVDGGSEHRVESHRRYLSPTRAAGLLEEAGFESIRWIRGYDSTTTAPLGEDTKPGGPFMVIAEL